MRKAFRVAVAVALALLSVGCATISAPQPPSLELPKPPSDLRAVRKGRQVTLSWTVPALTTDRQRVRKVGPTQICRGLPPTLTECGTPVGEAAGQIVSEVTKSGQKLTASYTDTLSDSQESSDPGAATTYAVEVLNQEHRGAGLSNSVRVSLIRTFPPPADFRAKVIKEGIELHWGGSVSRSEAAEPVHYLYRIYRRQEGQAWSVAGNFPAGGENDTSFTDGNIEWEKMYEYRIVTVTVTERGGSREEIEGEDSPLLKVFADDVFPPAVPSGLQAVFSGPGQAAFVDLVWAPVTDVDLDGYNVYRHEEGGALVKLNSRLVKAPAYRDAVVESGKRYFYSVSAVDVRGNESARSEEASERVP